MRFDTSVGSGSMSIRGRRLRIETFSERKSVLNSSPVAFTCAEGPDRNLASFNSESGI